MNRIHFLYNSKLYKNNKNNEAKIGKKIRANLEHWEAGKCKNKENKNDKLHFFKTRHKEMTPMPSQSLKALSKKPKSKTL